MNIITLLFKFLLLLIVTFSGPQSRAQTVTYFHNDLSGSPMASTDAAGNLIWKETYLPYGSKLINSTSAGTNAIGFHGKPHDNNSGLSYMSARYYDPLLGRFTGMDPKQVNPEEVHSFNRYSYAANNPYRYVDPDGHSPIDAIFFAHDVGKLAVALYKGEGVAEAATDVAISVVGLGSPVPGVGQAIKLARAADKVVDGAKTVQKAAKATKSNTNSKGSGGGAKEYGSYTNTHASGMKYHGKGSQNRAADSAKEKAEKYDDPVVSTDWTASPDERTSYKDEATRLENDGGHKSPTNYNQRASPGSKYKKIDGD